MSKIITVDVKIKSLGALNEACKELGFTLIPAKTFLGWGGRKIECELKIVVPDSSWEIGLVKNGGDWTMQCDHFLFRHEKVGENCGKLTQIYGVAMATMEARRRGLSVQRQNLPNGQIKLSLVGRFP